MAAAEVTPEELWQRSGCVTAVYIELLRREGLIANTPGTGSTITVPPPPTGKLGPWFTASIGGPAADPILVCYWGCRIDPGELMRSDGRGGYYCHPCGIQAEAAT